MIPIWEKTSTTCEFTDDEKSIQREQFLKVLETSKTPKFLQVVTKNYTSSTVKINDKNKVVQMFCQYDILHTSVDRHGTEEYLIRNTWIRNDDEMIFLGDNITLMLKSYLYFTGQHTSHIGTKVTFGIKNASKQLCVLVYSPKEGKTIKGLNQVDPWFYRGAKPSGAKGKPQKMTLEKKDLNEKSNKSNEFIKSSNSTPKKTTKDIVVEHAKTSPAKKKQKNTK